MFYIQYNVLQPNNRDIWGIIMHVGIKQMALFIFLILILIGFSLSNNLDIIQSNDQQTTPNISIIESAPKTPNINQYPLADEPVKFNNVSEGSNIDHLRSDSFAWGDYNNDGYLDFLARGNLTMGTRLYKNNGPPNWNFTDMTELLNLTGSGPKPNRGYPIWGDYNNDGYLDFFVAGDSDQLWKNNGPANWNFTNVTIAAGNLDDGRPTEAAAWGDYDRDGYLDLYVNSWYRGTTYYRDVLWHNDGDGTFTDVSNSAGIYTVEAPGYRSPPYAGMAVAWGDYNNDGWLDIYVGKYHITPNSLFRNNHDGTFTDIALTQGVAGNLKYDGSEGPYYGHTAGAGWADINNNGNLDLWVSNLAHKDPPRWFCDDAQMFRNMGGPFYEFDNIRDSIGIPTTPVGTTSGQYYKDEDFFGVTWGDFDNDADIDFWIPQVKTYHSWANSYLWRNNNDETFTDVSDAVGMKVWSNTGAAWGDYNNDGFLDLITEGTNPYQGKRETRLFKSDGNENSWLELRLKGVTSNTAAIGARVYATTGSLTQTREIGGDAGGHGFQNSFTVEFGLGNTKQVDEIKIIWPSGIVQILKNVPVNQIMNVTEDISGVKISSISASDYMVDMDEAITFDATVSGSANLYQWDYDNDGAIDWESTSGLTQTQHTYTKSGNYTAKLWVWDSSNDLGCMETTMFIQVNNPKPQLPTFQDINAWEDQVIEFNASGTTDTPSHQDWLKYNWSVGDDNYTGWQNSPIYLHAYPLEGTYDVNLKVRDDEFAISSKNFKVHVSNKLPSIEIIAPVSVPEDTMILFSAVGEDTPSDQSFLIYQWDFGDGNYSYWSNTTSVDHTYNLNGTYTVRCMVQDDEGVAGINSTEMEINVYNLEPECSVEEDKIAYEDQIVTLNGTGNDTNSDIDSLMFMWDFGDGKTSIWVYLGEQNTSHVYSKSGIYKARLIVKDDDGSWCYKIMIITVHNIKPKCTTDEDLEITEDEIVKFTGSGKDTKSDRDSLLYSWHLGILGVPDTPWSSTTDFNYKYTNEGIYTAILTVKDDDGDLGNASFKITVLNVAPQASMKVSTNTVSEDEIITFDASKSYDTPSDLEKLTYSWDFDDDTEEDFGVSQTHTYSSSGKYKVMLTVTDDNGLEDTVKQTITVENQKPEAKITAETTTILLGSEVVLSAKDSKDTISDMENLNFTWDLGDNFKESGNLISYTYKTAGTYTVKLTVKDNDDAIDDDQITIVVKEPIGGSEITSAAEGNQTDVLAMAGIIIMLIILLLILLIKFSRTTNIQTKKEMEENKEMETNIENKMEEDDEPPEQDGNKKEIDNKNEDTDEKNYDTTEDNPKSNEDND
jgi:PKD repeat protein